MKIKLYGSLICSRCKTAKMMLEKRNLKFEYIISSEEHKYDELPILDIDGEIYKAKEALMRIRELK